MANPESDRQGKRNDAVIVLPGVQISNFFEWVIWRYFGRRPLIYPYLLYIMWLLLCVGFLWFSTTFMRGYVPLLCVGICTTLLLT